MESDKFYADCWRKAKKAAGESIIKTANDENLIGKLKCVIAENLLEYYKDIEVEVTKEV